MVTLSPEKMLEIIILGYGLMGALSAWIILKIRAGKHWARSSLMWGFVLQAGWALVPPYESALTYLTDLPDYGLQFTRSICSIPRPGATGFARVLPFEINATP